MSGQQTNCDVIGIWPNATYECWLLLFVLLLCCQMSQLLGDLNSVSYWIFFLQKREKRMLANWKLLTRSLLIRERLKKRYDTEVHARPKLPSQESSFVIVCVPSPFTSRGGTVKETYRVFWLVARADKISQFFPRGIALFFPATLSSWATTLPWSSEQTYKQTKREKKTRPISSHHEQISLVNLRAGSLQQIMVPTPLLFLF